MSSARASKLRCGIKGVQSQNNLISYEREDMLRIVSERTICYCSNFDLDASEWLRQYITIKVFGRNLHKKLGKSKWISA